MLEWLSFPVFLCKKERKGQISERTSLFLYIILRLLFVPSHGTILKSSNRKWKIRTIDDKSLQSLLPSKPPRPSPSSLPHKILPNYPSGSTTNNFHSEIQPINDVLVSNLHSLWLSEKSKMIWSRKVKLTSRSIEVTFCSRSNIASLAACSFSSNVCHNEMHELGKEKSTDLTTSRVRVYHFLILRQE